VLLVLYHLQKTLQSSCFSMTYLQQSYLASSFHTSPYLTKIHHKCNNITTSCSNKSWLTPTHCTTCCITSSRHCAVYKAGSESDRQGTVAGWLLTTFGDDQCAVAKLFLVQTENIYAFSALKGHPACKKWMIGCWHGYLPGVSLRDADLCMAQLMPLPFTISCSSKSRLVLPSGTGSSR